MKIRTRLLLFLLPTLLGSVALVSILFAYNWYKLKELMASHIDLAFIEPQFHVTLFWILLGGSCAITITIATVLLIANKIARPIQTLNNSALAIAAGQYGESIHVEGPREIAELANTFNTMSECLLENINRLKDNSLLRERMYGEYECAMLLQHLMLQKHIDDCKSDAIAIQSITFFSDNPKGLLLDFPKIDRPELFHIHLAEAGEEGFEGMYQLLTQYKYSKESQDHTSVILNRNAKTLQSRGTGSREGRGYFFWSLKKRDFLPLSTDPIQTEPGDFFFLCNEGAIHFYKNPVTLRTLLAKVLKVFAQEGLKTTASMLHKEVAFATKRKNLKEDIHFLCFQILN